MLRSREATVSDRVVSLVDLAKSRSIYDKPVSRRQTLARVQTFHAGNFKFATRGELTARVGQREREEGGGKKRERKDRVYVCAHVHVSACGATFARSYMAGRGRRSLIKKRIRPPAAGDCIANETTWEEDQRRLPAPAKKCPRAPETSSRSIKRCSAICFILRDDVLNFSRDGRVAFSASARVSRSSFLVLKDSRRSMIKMMTESLPLSRLRR